MRSLILLIFIGAAFAAPKNGQRILGGGDVTVETYPFMSNLEHFYWWGRWVSACGGTLISARSVISAAHCFVDDGEPPSSWRVRLGTNFRSSGGDEYSVSSIITHPQFDKDSYRNDVAIMRLSTNAIFSNTVGTARLPGRNYNLPDESFVAIAGWGALWNGAPVSEHLQHINVYIINQKECAESHALMKTEPGYENWPDVTDDMVCADRSFGGFGACHGDFGGPLLHHRDVLVGIASWIYSCGDYFRPAVHSRVSYNIDWIVSNA